MNTPPRNTTLPLERHEEERRQEDLGANARRCRMCEGSIRPPSAASVAQGKYDRARASANLAGYCSLPCQGADVEDILARGQAWWQKEVRRG